MGSLTAIQDTIPDKDRFLPRYLSVELIDILSKVLPRPATIDINASSQRAKDFIAAQKANTQLFTNLTYNIFWREDATALLDSQNEAINLLDEYNRSPLTIALANEDFVLANQLVQHGAIVFMEHKLVLEIALISIIQLDPSIIDKVIAQAGKDNAWVKEYLEFLHGYAFGKPLEKAIYTRDVVDPTLRHFGQVLDTMVAFNGIPSHYGFISPSLDLITTHLQKYYKELTQPQQSALFKSISDAFIFTQRTCEYHCNMPNRNAAEIMYNQISHNITSTNKDIIFLTGGWAGNALAIAFIGKYLIYTNLGIGAIPDQATIIYEINNPSAITVTSVNNFLQGLGAAVEPSEIFAWIGEMVNPKPVYTIKQYLSPIDNCIFVNPRAIIQGIIQVLNALQKDSTLTNENLNAVSVATADMYGAYIDSLYMSSSSDLVSFMRNQELLRNKRVECCSLAIEYINQHYAEKESIKRCIELKNALEFVGLRDHYNQKIKPEAKTEIQKAMIKEQELTAIKVIEQEYSMQGKEKKA